MTPAIAARRAFRAGRFSEALDHLSATPRQNLEYQDLVILAEVMYRLGQSDVAAVHCERLRSKADLGDDLRCRCADLLARLHFGQEQLTEAKALIQEAVDFAERSGDPALMSMVAAHALEEACDKAAFHASLGLVTKVRRSALRTGDPHAKVSAHLAFARLEARAGNAGNALRHLTVAREILSLEPSLWLAAAVDLDESSVRALSGDLDTAWALATRARQLSDESGWARGKGIAATNLAYLAVLLGHFNEVEHHVRDAKRLLAGSPTHLLSVVDTEAQWAFCRGEFARAREVLSAVSAINIPRGRWYELTIQNSRARLLLRERRWTEAVEVADQCLPLAESAGAAQFVNSFRLSRFEALAELGRFSLSDLANSLPDAEASLDAVASYQIASGKALIRHNYAARGIRRARRGLRFYVSTGQAPLRKHAELVQKELDDTNDVSVRADAPIAAHQDADLDTAVALIELGAHPHILAREAFTAIKDARCADAVAVVVTGKDKPRVIETDGWSERDAIKAAANADGLVAMPAGSHRDEAWQVVARAKDGIDEHCTLAALGRIVAAAVALENYRRAEKQRAALWPAEALGDDGDAVWASEQTAELLAIARRVASTGLSVLVTGETGTGKEMLARAIHRASDRAGRPFLPFNCAAVPRDMIESQLFGYRKGAFTGADTGFAGVIRSAAGGTLFLDEIAELGLDLQPKLLRFLETHEIHPIGEPQPVSVDVRVICATNGNIDELVAAGRFREDLFYRLNVIRLKLPPLRERREEIPSLVQHYLRRHADDQKKGTLTLSDEALEYLLLYSWPGNVRQLVNEVRRMVALAEPNGALTPVLLSPEIQASRRTIAAADPSEPEVSIRLDQPLPVAVEMLEQVMVKRALDRSHGRVEEASRLLGISRKGLFLKRRRWGLPRVS